MKGNYSKQDIINALTEAGIQKADTVYVSTSLGLIGHPPENIKSADELCELFYNAIWDVIGKDGTLIVPAFSYTFGKGTASEPAVFDPQATPADVGTFPNFVLKQAGVKRSLDPMVSVACKGRRCAEFIKDLPPTSYGEGSFLSRLAQSDAKLLNLGIGPVWLPFVHHIDWLLKAPYRYDKLFQGFIKQGGELVPVRWVYNVRIRADNSYPSTQAVGKMAEEAGLWKSAPLGKIKIFSIVCDWYFEFAKNAAQKDPWLLVKGPAVDPASIENELEESKELVAEFLREQSLI
ncbi:MAG: hypothetical protein A2787_09580 [Omnitrophica WOR_2 bacterium RIFCSPHIGHO2_01_FULL_48_9]|nr:MAG: hypothetical protein A3D10_01915 [Omnitrophica WOR_2 bacterium RIFCSPHIGHO2_02_FULL_48_11]OGX31123.1 MAG: hypothetical protein A2787_09580 [Omnitrophica WOR_2 bacterium RIFCSPHIGHO2_01_FULL_48_9]